MAEVEARRYRITAVLGEGGFGKVYRARLEGAAGFRKDVAIKLMHHDDVPEDTLQRFRDEARILGLVRDRAIVSVDPPSRLDGRWAVVMEFVDGTSCANLVMSHGPMPPAVAVEIVQEVARALDKVYRMEGPDGQPLHIIHRDIKPGNIQVTPAGEVKVLDFGIARARFAAREANTTQHIGGTFGYIAPERLDGQDGAESDIYSLGVVLHVLVMGERPTLSDAGEPAEDDEDPTDNDNTPPSVQVARVLELAHRMRAPNHRKRPSAREVEDACAELRRELGGTTLRRWAEEFVERAETVPGDRLVGSLLTETLAALPSMHGAMDELRARRRRNTVLQLVGFAILGALLAILAFAVLSLLGFMGGVGMWLTVPGEAPPPVQQDPPPLVLPAPPEEPPAPPEAPPEVDEEEEPEPAPARTTPVPKAPSFPVSFSSVPMGATVYVDGRPIGKTPLLDVRIRQGQHRLEMRGPDGTKARRTITVGRRAPRRYIWEGAAEWEVHY